MQASQTIALPHRARRGHAPVHTWRAWSVRVLALTMALLLALYARRHWISNNAHPHNRVQRIAVLTPQRATPPKEEKPKEEPPKELDVQKPEVSVNVPAEAAPAGEKPQDDQLGVDADGEGPGDGFGLMGKRGAQDITTIGAGGTGGNGSGATVGVSRFNFGAYGGLVRQRMQNELMAIADLRREDYVAIVSIWIDARGHIERVELPQGSGLDQIDSALRQAFARMPVLPEPPAALPQPLRLRITSRDLVAK
jgi:protein TonB